MKAQYQWRKKKNLRLLNSTRVMVGHELEEPIWKKDLSQHHTLSVFYTTTVSNILVGYFFIVSLILYQMFLFLCWSKYLCNVIWHGCWQRAIMISKLQQSSDTLSTPAQPYSLVHYTNRILLTNFSSDIFHDWVCRYHSRVQGNSDGCKATFSVK